VVIIGYDVTSALSLAEAKEMALDWRKVRDNKIDTRSTRKKERCYPEFMMISGGALSEPLLMHSSGLRHRVIWCSSRAANTVTR
jgi:hypothetical protein